jgi:hypothetical protein
MTKSSTITHLGEKKDEGTEEKILNKNLNSEYADIMKQLELQQLELQQLELQQFEAPKKSVKFILDFSKAYRAKKLSNGGHAEMIIN